MSCTFAYVLPSLLLLPHSPLVSSLYCHVADNNFDTLSSILNVATPPTAFFEAC